MQMELQMVGAYQNANITIKGISFVNGRASFVSSDDHVAGICRYLAQFGAYPLIEAEQRQAKLDKAAGRKISKKVALDRVARHRAALEQAMADLDELDQIDENAATQRTKSNAPPPRIPNEPSDTAAMAAESEPTDGGSSDQPPAPEGRSEATEDQSSSSKKRGNGK